jgi:hypothetical protein
MIVFVVIALTAAGLLWAIWRPLANRPVTRTLVGFVVLSVGLAASVLGLMVWYRTWHPFMDDGPFHGVPRVAPPFGTPTQVFSIYSGNTLEVFAPQPLEPGPTVRLRNASGNVLWSIYAVADAKPNTTVSSIRFLSSRRILLERPTVLAEVRWEFGTEMSWWYIKENGVLQEYWFSW